ncbi:hypothetical protein, partial [Marinobacter sp.]|uniref:hypothetical protein n=1 Tax=Marinobacter sp. TaxID=50741 RepID=UPI0035C6EE43
TKASKSSEKPKTTETSKASETAETAETTNSAGRLVNLEFFGMADSVSSNAALIVHSKCPLCDQGYSRASAKQNRTFEPRLFSRASKPITASSHSMIGGAYCRC